LWCAMLAFMGLRAIILALLLPGIERKSFTVAAVAPSAVS
jgi:hypothetical protein